MDRGTSDKIKNILNQDFNFNIVKIIGSYADFDKSYMAFLYWETNEELYLITEVIKEKIKNLFIDYFKKEGLFPKEVQDIILYFDSNENVQKNYDGNYFYATR